MEVTRRTLSGRARFVVLLVVLATASVAVVFGAATGRATHKQTVRIPAAALRLVSALAPAPGSVSLTNFDKQQLARFAQGGQTLTDVAALDTRGGRVYYRVTNTSGPDCYAVGPAAMNTDYRLGQIQCEPDFPSAARPIQDFTVVIGGLKPDQPAHVYRSEGIAADGVADIGFLTPDGQLVDVHPVVNNIYSNVTPTSRDVSDLVARDANGTVIYKLQIAH
jgi:hypothetical protein